MPPIWDDRPFTLHGTSSGSSPSQSVPRVPFTSHPCSLSSGVPFGIGDEKLPVPWLGKQPFLILSEATRVGRGTGSSPGSVAL